MKPMPFDKSLGRVMKALRELREQKQIGVTYSLKYNESSLSRFENGQRVWAPGRIKELATVLNISAAEVMVMAEFAQQADFENTETEQLIKDYLTQLAGNRMTSSMSTEEIIRLVEKIKYPKRRL